MKKQTSKLMLCKETVAALNPSLTERVAGGHTEICPWTVETCFGTCGCPWSQPYTQCVCE